MSVNKSFKKALVISGFALLSAFAVSSQASSAPEPILTGLGSVNCTINGTQNADKLTGTSGDDVICGFGGNDTIDGAGGNDVLVGGDGNDILKGGDGNDVLMGGNGNDTFDGGAGTNTADYTGIQDPLNISLEKGSGTGNGSDKFVGLTIQNIYGGSGYDILTGNALPNFLDGGLGNDTLMGMGGNDTLNGGLGIDLVSASAARAGVIIDLAIASMKDLVASPPSGLTADKVGVDFLSGIENILGSVYNDVLTGDSGANVISGGNGDDAISGGAGNDNLLGGSGVDNILGGSGNDSVDAGLGNDSVDAGTGDDSVLGGAGDDTLLGSDGNDSLLGGTGNDSINGGVGNDSLIGDAGNDTIVGGDGLDNIAGGVGNDALDGGNGDDYIIGEAGNDTIYAGNGRDTANGGVGNDLVDGGLGDDLLSGEAGNDNMLGGDGNDSLIGADGNDKLDGGLGNDGIDGGLGSDSLLGGDGNDNLLGGDGNDTVTGGTGDDTVSGDAGTDILTGSDGNDTLIGGDGNDKIDGGNGKDRLVGGNGDDLLQGGAGNDGLLGGAGTDTLAGSVGAPAIGERNLCEKDINDKVTYCGFDDAAPYIVSAEILNPNIDTSATDATVHVSLRITDELMGTKTVNCALQNGRSSFSFVQARLTSGDSIDGTWECDMVVPKGSSTREYGLNLGTNDAVGNMGIANQSRDGNGNSTIWHSNLAEIMQPGGNFWVNQVGAGDNASPRVSSVDFINDTIDTSESAMPVSVRFAATDDYSGIVAAQCGVRRGAYELGSTATLESGTYTNGVWRCDIQIPQNAAQGQWGLAITLRDGTGKSYSIQSSRTDGETWAVDDSEMYTPAPITGLGVNFFTQIAPGDDAPPVVTSISLDNPTINTSSQDKKVVVTVNLSDASGVKSLGLMSFSAATFAQNNANCVRVSSVGSLESWNCTFNYVLGTSRGLHSFILLAYDNLGQRVEYRVDTQTSSWYHHELDFYGDAPNVADPQLGSIIGVTNSDK